MRAFMVCVDYADLLAVTLPYNRHHFREVWVVTTGRDAATREVALENRAKVFATDAFYDDGARFNKWRALEQCLDHAGRLGWMCLMDADVLWPKDVVVQHLQDPYGSLVLKTPSVPGVSLQPGHLCTPRRRMAPWPYPFKNSAGEPMLWEEGLWGTFPLHRNDAEFAGYSQIFHATDPALGSPPWHETGFCHAGISDSLFQAKWRPERKVRPPFEVLHLGEAGVNWAGRATKLGDGTELPGSAERREYSSRTIWEMRRRNRATGRDQFADERLG